MSLRDVAHRGVRTLAALAVVGGGASEQLRATAGVDAQVFGEPLRLGFSWSLDLRGEGEGGTRAGDGDLRTSAAWVLADEGRLSLSLEAGAWLPTGASEAGLDGVRLAPSLHLGYRVAPGLTLRTRQGALLDARGTGARLWASASGVTFRPVAALALGLELDASLGRDREAPRRALGAGIWAGLRAGLVELSLGARLALGPDARRLMGRWAAVLALRLATQGR